MLINVYQISFLLLETLNRFESNLPQHYISPAPEITSVLQYIIKYVEIRNIYDIASSVSATLDY